MHQAKWSGGDFAMQCTVKVVQYRYHAVQNGSVVTEDWAYPGTLTAWGRRLPVAWGGGRAQKSSATGVTDTMLDRNVQSCATICAMCYVCISSVLCLECRVWLGIEVPGAFLYHQHCILYHVFHILYCAKIGWVLCQVPGAHLIRKSNCVPCLLHFNQSSSS